MNWPFLKYFQTSLHREKMEKNLHHCVSCKKSFWSADSVSKYCFINFQCRISLIKSGAFLSASKQTRKYVSSTGCAIPSGGGVRTQYVLQLRILYQENSGSFFSADIPGWIGAILSSISYCNSTIKCRECQAWYTITYF